MWNRTLAGLTIPGPCRDGEYAESHRLCTYAATWAPVDYEQCFQQGCGEDAGWPSTPARVTLRRDCGAGYRGYQYRHCMADGAWGAVEDGDCGRLAAGE